jgi:hypothetical protein
MLRWTPYVYHRALHKLPSSATFLLRAKGRAMGPGWPCRTRVCCIEGVSFMHWLRKELLPETCRRAMPSGHRFRMQAARQPTRTASVNWPSRKHSINVVSTVVEQNIWNDGCDREWGDCMRCFQLYGLAFLQNDPRPVWKRATPRWCMC